MTIEKAIEKLNEFEFPGGTWRENAGKAVSDSGMWMTGDDAVNMGKICARLLGAKLKGMDGKRLVFD